MALTMRVVLALATLMVATGPAWAAERPPQVLYRQWVKVTVECRGGTDSAAVDAACKRRNVIDRELNTLWDGALAGLTRTARIWTGIAAGIDPHTIADATTPRRWVFVSTPSGNVRSRRTDSRRTADLILRLPTSRLLPVLLQD